MARTKKSSFEGSGYQKLNERILILENAIKNAIDYLNHYKIQDAQGELLAAWIREQNL